MLLGQIGSAGPTSVGNYATAVSQANPYLSDPGMMDPQNVEDYNTLALGQTTTTPTGTNVEPVDMYGRTVKNLTPKLPAPKVTEKKSAPRKTTRSQPTGSFNEGPTRAEIAKGIDPKATFEPNRYTTTPVEKALGITSVPRSDARGASGQTITTEAKNLSWTEVQDLRANSTVANRNKLADWNDHVKNGTASKAGKDGNSGSGDSDRVICTELYKQGKLDRELYRMDVMYTAKHLSDTTVRGYHYWAIPMVVKMRSSTYLTNVFKYLTIARAKEIAHIVKPEKYKKRSVLGYLIKNVGEAICFSVGLFVVQKDWTVLYKGNQLNGN